tara:strand:+ start:182 stop:427 length:246 start_codon:yes stop_codon:yes gene_type:complete
LFFSLLTDFIGKKLDRLRKEDNFKERKKIIYQVIFWSVSGILSLILYIPPELSFVQITYAIVVFFLIVYFAIRAVKYFKIL